MLSELDFLGRDDAAEPMTGGEADAPLDAALCGDTDGVVSGDGDGCVVCRVGGDAVLWRPCASGL